MNKTENINFRVTEEMRRNIEIRSDKAKRSIGDYCRILIEEAIERDSSLDSGELSNGGTL